MTGFKTYTVVNWTPFGFTDNINFVEEYDAVSPEGARVEFYSKHRRGPDDIIAMSHTNVFEGNKKEAFQRVNNFFAKYYPDHPNVAKRIMMEYAEVADLDENPEILAQMI